MTLEWTNFRSGTDAKRAFESFCSQLFEEWCFRFFHPDVLRIVHINGAGGDGGVEAYCDLANGSQIGLQAKWFREPLGKNQISQIQDSIRAASTLRPQVKRYLIAIPRNLSDRAKPAETSERDRWDRFAESLKKKYPAIEFELWDEARLEREALFIPGAIKYWFEKSSFEFSSVARGFAAQMAGWLLPRYCPELHSLGRIEADLESRIGGTPPVHFSEEAKRLKLSLSRCLDAVRRLQRYPEYSSIVNSIPLQQKAENCLEAAIAGISDLEARCRFRGGIVTLPSSQKIDVSPLFDLARALQEATKGWPGAAPLTPTLEMVDAASNECLQVFTLALELVNLGRPALYVGRPGSGKTQALAHSVESALAGKRPALLIRARDFDPHQGWEGILRKAVGGPSWTLSEILDGLEGAACEAELQQSAGVPDSDFTAIKTLIAIDGIDESLEVQSWGERLAELPAIIRGRARLCFVASVRDTVEKRLGGLPEWLSVLLHDSDAPIGRLFKQYLAAYRIECPSSLRWALESPLALRLFCEEFQGQTVAGISSQDLAVQKLIGRKIKRIENEVAQLASEAKLKTWPTDHQLVLKACSGLAKAYVESGKPLESASLITILEQTIEPNGVLNSKEILWLLERCTDAGLVLKTQKPGEGPLEPSRILWEPANDVFADYLVAYQQANLLKGLTLSGNPKRLPDILVRRPNALLLCLSILLQLGIDWYAMDLWAAELNGHERDRALLWCIRSLQTEKASSYEPFIAIKLAKSMPDCRDVLALLVIPSLRDVDAQFGARFVDKHLTPLRVAERDLFWSGPNRLPMNQGASWEGLGLPALEELELSADDPWDTAPLLACWGLATVVESERHRLRNQLARWGNDNPNGLVSLLSHMASCNDPQIVEDILTATFGAVCLSKKPNDWRPLAAWVSELPMGFEGKALEDNAVVRNAMRGVMQRLAAFGCQVSPEANAKISRTDGVTDRLLPLDLKAASISSDFGSDLIHNDLAWYVVPNSIKPFEIGSRDQKADDLEALLERHRQAYGLKSLTPFQFAVAFVTDYARNLGWNEPVFIGKTNGGKPGEVVGADIAILREHYHARHGAHSPVATFSEKYIWAAVHHLSGYLADRLPVRVEEDWQSLRTPPVDVSYVCQFPPNPAADSAAVSSRHMWIEDTPVSHWQGLIPSVDLVAGIQLQMANDWVEKAPVPEPMNWLQVESFLLPFDDAEPWAVLKAYATLEELDSRGEDMVQITSLVVPEGSKTSVVAGGAVDFEFLIDAYGSISGWGTYADPAEAVWAPWITDSYSERDLRLSDGGTISGRTTSTKVTRNGADTEEDWLLPSEWLRKQLGLVSLDEDGFYWDSQRPVAGYIRAGVSSWKSPFCEMLIIRKHDFMEACKRAGVVPVWWVKVFRKPSTSLTKTRNDHSYLKYKQASFKWLAYENDGAFCASLQSIERTVWPYGDDSEESKPKISTTPR